MDGRHAVPVKAGLEDEAERIRAHALDPKLWTAAHTVRRWLGTHVPGDRPPDPPADRQGQPQILGAGPNVRVSPVGNPDPRASLGFAGPAALVVSAESLFEGDLFLPIEGAEEKGIAVDTVRVFHWRTDSRSFALVDRSGASEGLWAWARIAVPGVYVPIGLPRDPMISRLLKILVVLSDLTADAPSEVATRLHREIGALLLRSVPSLITGRDQIPQYPRPGGPNQDLPDFLSGDARIDPQIALEVIARGGLPPEAQVLVDPSPLRPVQSHWEFVGPHNIAGQSLGVVEDPSDPETIYTWSPHGGVWRLVGASRHPETTWECLTDDLPTQNVQAFAVAPSDNLILYVQTTDGVFYRSDDAGFRWTRVNAGVGLAHRIVVDPRWADRVLVATTDGLWRSRDGLRVWDGGPLYRGDATDLVIDPVDPDVTYLAVRDGGVLRSTRGGDSESWLTVLRWDPRRAYWSDPAKPVKLIRIAVGRSGDPSRRRIAVMLGQEVYYNESGGTGPWEPLGQVGGVQTAHPMGHDSGQGGFSHCLGLDPFDERVVFAGLDMLYRYRVDEGGNIFRRRSWAVAVPYRPDDNIFRRARQSHPDYHGIAFSPAGSGVMYVANDGGVYRSGDHGVTWRSLARGLHTLEHWFICGTAGGPLLTGAYHHGLIASRDLTSRDWQFVSGGAFEFASAFPDPTIPGRFYVCDVQSPTSGLALATVTRRVRSTEVDYTMNTGWRRPPINAVAVDPRPESRSLFAGGGDSVFRTRARDEATPTWTRQDVAIGDGDAVAYIAYSALSDAQPPYVYVLTRSGVVHRATALAPDDAGIERWDRRGSWGGDMRQIVVNPFDPERIYVVSYTQGVAMSDDGGRTFTSIAMPGVAPFSPSSPSYSSLLPHPSSPATLLLCTTLGVFYTEDEGAAWRQYGVGLPTVHVVVAFRDGPYVYAATFGRGLWRRRLL